MARNTSRRDILSLLPFLLVSNFPQIAMGDVRDSNEVTSLDSIGYIYNQQCPWVLVVVAQEIKFNRATELQVEGVFAPGDWSVSLT